MKKGLTIALLMVAMVALAASASALAPTITNLPSVIIGDAGDVSGGGTTALSLLRYENVLDLAGVVSRPNNPTTTEFMSVFYTVSGATLQASNATAIVPAMSGPELTSLLGGTAPAGRKINTATDTMLSLINDAKGSPTSAASASAGANGATAATLTADGALAPNALTLWATDSSVATDKVGSGTMIVYSVLGVADSYSPAAEVVYNSGNLGTATGHDGWTYNAQSGAQTGPNANLQSVPSLATGTGVGFTGLATFSAGKSQGFSSWEHTGNGTILAPAASMANKIFRATMHMSGNAASPLLCPSYRILFLSTGFAHAGGFQVTTTGGTTDTDSAINYPSASTASGVDTRMYWGVPTSTNQYADGQQAATVAGSEDKRSYYMTFDIMQAEAGDVGTIVMETVLIEKIVRPSGVTPTISWGTGGRAFNETATAWSSTGNDGGTGWGTGVFTLSDANITMKMQSTRTSVFCQVNPIVSETAGYPAWTSNKLVRVTYVLSASNTATCPQIRMFVLPWRVPLGTFQLGNTLWGEALDPSVWRGWYPFSSGLGLAASPKTTGSTIETYIYTMNAPTDSGESCILTPSVDIDQNAVQTFPTNGWSKPDATVTMSGCSFEVLNP